MQTIGYFGDSFCAGREPKSWCVLLAGKLDAKITHWGEPGRSIWTTMMSFNRINRRRALPDICVFCWTEPYRLYHPNLILTANTEPSPEADPKIYKALNDYFKYLHSYDKDELTYEYSIKWFDQEILSKVDKKIIQLWSFRPFETAGKDANINLKTGIFIDESILSFSKTYSKDQNWKRSGVLNLCERGINHMTIEQNEKWADKVYERIKS